MGFTPTDVGEYILSLTAVPSLTATSTGTAVNGDSIDRLAQGSPYKSCQIVVPFSYIKTTGVTGSMNAHLQDSAVSASTSTSWADFGSTVASAGSGVYTIAATTAAVTAGRGVYRRNVDITAARRYIRVRVTPLLTAATLSTVNLLRYMGVLVLGGSDEYPATS